MCVIDSGHEKKCVAVSQAVKPANLETHMPLGTLAIRKKDSNTTHHLYRNGNLWWVHFFVHHSSLFFLCLKRTPLREVNQGGVMIDLTETKQQQVSTSLKHA